MAQGIVFQQSVFQHVLRNIAAWSRRPESWLAALLVWALGSAARSLGTPWAQAVGTEALRWGAGIILALMLRKLSARQADLAGQFLVTLTGALAVFGILGGETAAHSGLAGPYHDHQLYGSVLVLLVPISAVFAFSASSAPWRWGSLAALAAGTLCLLLSETRSAWAGLAAAAFVFSWLWLRRTASHSLRPHVALIPAALLLVGLLLAWLLAGPAAQQAAMTHRAATLAALSQDGSWQSRLDLWHGTARMIAAHPALGIGLGRYPGSVWLWNRAAGLLPPHSHPSLSNEAHSFYGQTAAETGLLGLGLYGAALAAFAALSLRRLREARSQRQLHPQNALLIGVFSALAGQSVDALASPSWQFPEVSFFFWAVLGLGLASLRQAQPVPAGSDPVSAPLLLSVRRAGRFALSGGLAVALTAQILPIGLLTPVEAYDHLASNAFQSMTLNQTPCMSGGQVCFSLTAVYSDGTHDVTLDSGGLSNTPSSFSCKYASSPCSTTLHATFGTGTARNQLAEGTGNSGKTVQITGSFEDGSYSSSPFIAGKGTYTTRTVTLPVTLP